MQRFFTSVLSPCAATVQAGSPDSTVTYVRSRLPVALLTVLVMLLLKQHYSTATATQIDWILAPTAKLVAWLTSANPVWESGVGYVDFSRGIIVAPACAGINFMIMAFGLAAFCGLHKIRKVTHQAAWLLSALAAAYGLALLVNMVRIAASMVLYQADIYSGWMTVERVHRLTGVVLYFAVLWLYFLGLRPIIASYCSWFDHRTGQWDVHLPDWLPPGWYLLGALGVPLANQAWKRGLPSFAEHCVTVLLATLAVWAAATAVNRLRKTLRDRVSHRLRALHSDPSSSCPARRM